MAENQEVNKEQREKQDNDALVNSNHPIWHCKNAFKLEDTCKYAMCSIRYINEGHDGDVPQGRKSSRSYRGNKNDNDDLLCNHEQLEFYSDSLYYTKAALEERKKEESIHFPFNCVVCGKAFYSKG